MGERQEKKQQEYAVGNMLNSASHAAADAFR